MAALERLPWGKLLLRSLAIQGSWNFRTMQGAGLGFAMIPVLRQLYGREGQELDEALQRHSRFFNGHPYLSTVAIAALAQMEAEDADSEQMDRFKSAIVSPLGSLGDRLVWARWRPLSVLLGLLVFLAGAPWWVACLVFLTLYNVVNLGLRAWGLRLGWRHGRRVGHAMLASPLRRLPDRFTIPLAMAAGALLPPLALALGAGSGVGSLTVIGISLAFAAMGSWHPAIASRLAVLGVLVGTLVIVASGSVW